MTRRQVQVAFRDDLDHSEPPQAAVRLEMGSLGSTVLWAMLLAALAMLAYSRPLLTGLFKHDQKIRDMFIFVDNANVKDNAALRSWRGIVPIWRDPLSMPQFSPIGYASLLLDYNIWGKLASKFHLDYRTFLQRLTFAYHATNVLIHICNALLIWAIAKRLGLRGAWVAGAIFALHPLAVQSVTWISQRPVLLGMFFLLAALLAYLRFANPISPGEESAKLAPTRRSRSLSYALSLVLFLAAVLSDPATAILPLLVSAIVWWKRERFNVRDALPLIPHLLIALVVLAGTLAIANRPVHASAFAVLDSSPAISLLQRIPVAGRAIWFYFVSSLLPIRLSFAYPRWDVTQSWQWIFPIGIVLVLQISWVWRSSALVRNFFAATMLFVLALLPGIIFARSVSLRGGFVADSLAYIALPAIVVPIVAIVARSLDSRDVDIRWPGRLVTAMALSAFIVITFRTEQTYQSNHVLWAHTLEQYPRSTYALNRVGEMELAKKQFSEAELREMQVLRLDPDAGFTPVKKPYTAAESCFRQALAIDANDWAAMIDLGQVFQARGEWAQAASQYYAAERAGAPKIVTHQCLADTFQARGNSSEAMRLVQSILDHNPDSATARNSLGMIRYQRGEYPEAIAEYKRAIDLNPRLAVAHTNLAGVYSAQGRHVEALNELTDAWQIEPDNAQTLMNVAAVLGTLSEGRPPVEKLQLLREAEKRFKDAIALDSEFAPAWDNLGIVLAREAQNDPNQAGKMKDAVYAFSRAASLDPENEKYARHLESAIREGGAPPPDNSK